MPFSPFTPNCLRGQTALVTGAAGGIGRVVARRLAELGAAPVLADLRRDSVDAVLASLPGPACTDGMAWSGDLTDEASVGALFEAIRSRYGALHIVVNTAGVLRTTPFAEIPKAEWDAVMDANVGSAFLVCRHAVPLIQAQGSGSIVNFASISGQVGGILSGAHYAAAKAAVISLTRSVAKLLAPNGARCNAIAPAGVEGEMLNAYSPAQKQALTAGIPLGRFAQPEEIAELVAWLASPASAYITGQTLGINGGSYLG